MKSRLHGQGQRATSAAARHPHPPGPPVWIRVNLSLQLPSQHAALWGLTPPELPSSLTFTLKLCISLVESGRYKHEVREPDTQTPPPSSPVLG